jgi:hypothetical protein
VMATHLDRETKGPLGRVTAEMAVAAWWLDSQGREREADEMRAMLAARQVPAAEYPVESGAGPLAATGRPPGTLPGYRGLHSFRAGGWSNSLRAGEARGGGRAIAFQRPESRPGPSRPA